MKNKTVQSSMVLLLTSVVWGMGFVSQRFGMDHVGPFFFSGARGTLATLTMLLTIAVTGAALRLRKGGRADAGGGAADIAADREKRNWIVKGGVVCGIVLFLGQSLQQMGIVFTTASKAGFLTALYMVLVPILGLFLKKHTHWNTWVSIPVAAAGLYFLSITTKLTIMPGDLIIIIGAVAWAFHILVTDHYVPHLTQRDVLKLVTIQFSVSAALFFVCMPILDMKFVPIELTVDIVYAVMPALLYAGIISAGVGFTLQAIGQRNVSPAAAGLIMSLEAVFGAIGGALILGERLSPRELVGCILVFGAVVFAQLPVKDKIKPAPARKKTGE